MIGLFACGVEALARDVRLRSSPLEPAPDAAGLLALVGEEIARDESAPQTNLSLEDVGDLVLAFDTSASIGEVEVRRAHRVGQDLADQLPSSSRVRVVYGDVRAWACVGEAQGGHPGAGFVEKCMQHRSAHGASDLGLLLGTALNAAKGMTNPRVVMFSDGTPSLGEIDADLLVAGVRVSSAETSTTVHTVAIGVAPDEEFMREVARAGRGHAVRLRPRDGGEGVVSPQMFRKGSESLQEAMQRTRSARSSTPPFAQPTMPLLWERARVADEEVLENKPYEPCHQEHVYGLVSDSELAEMKKNFDECQKTRWATVDREITLRHAAARAELKRWKAASREALFRVLLKRPGPQSGKGDPRDFRSFDESARRGKLKLSELIALRMIGAADHDEAERILDALGSPPRNRYSPVQPPPVHLIRSLAAKIQQLVGGTDDDLREQVASAGELMLQQPGNDWLVADAYSTALGPSQEARAQRILLAACNAGRVEGTYCWQVFSEHPDADARARLEFVRLARATKVTDRELIKSMTSLLEQLGAHAEAEHPLRLRRA